MPRGDVQGHLRDLAGPQQAIRISTLDFRPYQQGIADSFAEAIRRFDGSTAVALYFEYDLDNDWDSAFFLCPEYNPESAEDEDWACDFVDDIAGPGFPEASELYRENNFDRTPMALGSTLYLVARTVAAFGRCAERVQLKARAICIGFHDQTPVTRVREA